MQTLPSPTVSVVIPTYKRPQLVVRAVTSALNQTCGNLEVLVVVDGADDVTGAALQVIADARLRVFQLSENVGAAAARNYGVSQSMGVWIAFLDDDDEWFPEKIAKQLERAEQSIFPMPIVSCQVIGRDGICDEVWPRQKPTVPLCEYLLTRRSLSYGDNVLPTTTLFAPRELLQLFQFRSVMPLEDWDWMLRCESHPGVGVEFIPEPLALWYVPAKRVSLSSRSDWRSSLRWLQENRKLTTPRAYAGFIAGTVALHACRQRDWAGLWKLLWEMRRGGRPEMIDYALFFGRAIPEHLRRRITRPRKTLPGPGPAATHSIPSQSA